MQTQSKKQKRPTKWHVTEKYCGTLQATRSSLYRLRDYTANRTDNLKLNSKVYQQVSALIDEMNKTIKLLKKEEH